jgi:hypothetical protein
LRPDYYPRTDDERRRVLDAIQKHGDVDVFKRAARLRGWLSGNPGGGPNTSRRVSDARARPPHPGPLPRFAGAREGASVGTDSVLVQWARDSAYRFFPLVEHSTFGLTLHPLDLATNKLLAIVGRREVRDWIDIVECHDKVQPLG